MDQVETEFPKTREYAEYAEIFVVPETVAAFGVLLSIAGLLVTTVASQDWTHFLTGPVRETLYIAPLGIAFAASLFASAVIGFAKGRAAARLGVSVAHLEFARKLSEIGGGFDKVSLPDDFAAVDPLISAAVDKVRASLEERVRVLHGVSEKLGSAGRTKPGRDVLNGAYAEASRIISDAATASAVVLMCAGLHLATLDTDGRDSIRDAILARLPGV